MELAIESLVIDVHLNPEDLREAFCLDVRTGFTNTPKRLSPVWFYDDFGSSLFDEITRLPEYYPTRAERRLLETHAEEIVARCGADTLVELGAGTCEKTRVLLDRMKAKGTLSRYIPFDVSGGTLKEAAASLVTDYPGLRVHGVVGDFHRHLGRIPTGGRRLVAFLGSTIGNLIPAERRRFLFDLDCTMTAGDRLLLGTDLVKDSRRLIAAYDDSAGVTATFNRNVLTVLNRELGADIDINNFEHIAVWNAEEEWIEMRLRSTIDQTVKIPELDMVVALGAGEEILTEISAKFTPEKVESELAEVGFVVEEMWSEPGEEFLLTLATPYC